MDRKLWSHSAFFDKIVMDWPCPSCGKATLELDEKRFHKSETAESFLLQGHPDWDYEWTEYTFIGYLHCPSVSCNETVSFIGSARDRRDQFYDEREKKEIVIDSILFEPKYFFPPLLLFPIIDKCPVSVKKGLISAFGLLWADAASCGNKIRFTVETILNDKGIPAKSANGKFIFLADRLKALRKTEPVVTDFFEAIKFIGNDGSHPGEIITREDVLDAFELIEHGIELLYDNKTERLKQRSKEIIDAYKKRGGQKPQP